MNSIAGLHTIAAGLALLLTITPSWAGPPNPTDSDALGNTAGGNGALQNVTSGERNTAFGQSALLFNTTGRYNTAYGSGALYYNNGALNTAVGISSLALNTTGGNNSGCGASALFSNTNGSYNSASGALAMIDNTTGSDNTASGYQALTHNVAGLRNTAIGSGALAFSTGNKNIAIGFQAGAELKSGHNNVYVGNGGASSESQTIRIGTAQTRAFIAGVANAVVSGAMVQIETSTGQIGIAPSSVRFKHGIVPMGSQSEGVLKLRPVTFVYKDDTQGMRRFGLIAEEVAAVYPDLVTRAATGEVHAVKYQELIPMLLNELQRQSHAIERQERELALLRGFLEQERE